MSNNLWSSDSCLSFLFILNFEASQTEDKEERGFPPQERAC